MTIVSPFPSDRPQKSKAAMSVKVVSVKTDDVIVCASRVRGNVRQAFIDALTDKMAAEITLPVRWEDRDFPSKKLGGCQGGMSPLVFIYPPDKNSNKLK